MWSRHVEQLGRLLRRQLGLHRNDCHSVSVRELAEDLEQQIESLTWDGGITFPAATLRVHPHALGQIVLRERSEIAQCFARLLGGLWGW